MSKTNNSQLVARIQNILSKNFAHFFCSINSRNSSTAFLGWFVVIIFSATAITYVTSLRVQFKNVPTIIVCFFCKTGAVARMSGLFSHRTRVVNDQHDICCRFLSHGIRHTRNGYIHRIPSLLVNHRLTVRVTSQILRERDLTLLDVGRRRHITRRYDRHQPDDHQYGHNERQHSSHFHRKNTSFF